MSRPAHSYSRWKKLAKKTKPLTINHELKPKHSVMNDKEKNSLFSKYKITFNELPKITLGDAGLAGLEVKEGDIIKITRKSPTSGTTAYYRGVINV